MARKLTVACAALWLVIGYAAIGAEENRHSLWSQVDVQVYGRLKADAAYDTSRVDPGNYVRWVDPSGEKDDEFNLTASETRLGINFKGPDAGSAKTSGKVEIDFYGNSAATDAENKAKPMMRHAYAVLEFPQWSLLAGQTSDIVSPLVPRTLNYSVMWWVGNIGYRRPQIRFIKQADLCKDTKLKLDAGISRTIGESFGAFTETGEDAGVPTVQARAGLTFPFLAQPATLGLSGHYGKEEFGSLERTTWSLNLDALVPLMDSMTFKGEYFVGKNLDAFLGGIGQGINQGKLLSIEAQGGWMAVEMEAGKGWSFTGGVGMDDPRDADLVGAPGNPRKSNRCVFGNAIYALSKNAKVGFELSQWRTDYVGTGPVDDVRGQMSVIYEF